MVFRSDGPAFASSGILLKFCGLGQTWADCRDLQRILMVF